jgi:hypothetical protein
MTRVRKLYENLPEGFGDRPPETITAFAWAYVRTIFQHLPGGMHETNMIPSQVSKPRYELGPYSYNVSG